MPAVARETDTILTGHLCDTVSTIKPGTTGNSVNVFANNLGIACSGDAITVHTTPSGPACVPHNAFTGQGSATVFIGGKSVNRISDPADLGSINGGSNNVFVGG